MLIITLPVNVFVPVVLLCVRVPETDVIPETVKLKPPTVREDKASIFRVAHVAAPFTVMYCEPSIKTSSPATGKLAPGNPPDVVDHVAFEFQLPLATE